MKEKRRNTLGSQEPTEKRNKALWTPAHRQHTDVHSLAANSRLKSRPLSKYRVRQNGLPYFKG